MRLGGDALKSLFLLTLDTDTVGKQPSLLVGAFVAKKKILSALTLGGDALEIRVL